MERPLLVLDLDETLVHAAYRPMDRPEDFRLGPYFTYCRPFLAEFVRRIFVHFDAAVWTSAGADYAECLVERIFPEPGRLKFVWSAAHCTLRHDWETQQQHPLKNFAKLRRKGYDLRRILAIDDSPEKHRRNYGNLIRVEPFFGDPADTELNLLLPYLEFLRSSPDYRRIEKRNWRDVARGLAARHDGSDQMQ